jgi:tetratricopeptide (TPR) repeat protein
MDYDKAIVKLQQVRTNTPENANVDHLLGLCYLNSGNSYEKAVFYLSRSLNNTSMDYQEWDLDETRAPLKVMYLLAKAYESTEHFDMAANLYAEFLAAQSAGPLHPSSKTYALINRSAESCRLAAASQGAGTENENIVFNQ